MLHLSYSSESVNKTWLPNITEIAPPPPLNILAGSAPVYCTTVQRREEVRWRPVQEASSATHGPTKVLRKQMYCRWRKYLWYCWDVSAPATVIRRPHGDSAPEELCPSCPHRYAPASVCSAYHVNTTARGFNSCLCFSYQSIRENTIQSAAILIKEHFLTLPGSGLQLKRHFSKDLL